jgi:hypothetical protein
VPTDDPVTCCCGSFVGEGGDICHHGGCRSMVEYGLPAERNFFGRLWYSYVGYRHDLSRWRSFVNALHLASNRRISLWLH